MKPFSEHNDNIVHLGLAGRFARLFLVKRELSILSILVVVVWGTLSFVAMPKQYNPEIVAPAFVISTDFPDATAEEVYELITRPMEDVVAELPSIDTISSRSLPGGTSLVMVRFLVGSSMDEAKTALNQKLRDRMYRKPPGALDPSIVSIDPEDVPILDIGLSSPVREESSLRQLAFDIADELKLTEGISVVDIRGGRTNGLRIEPNGAKLMAYDLTLSDLVRAVGSVRNIHAVEAFDGDERHPRLTVSGEDSSIETLRATVIRNDADGIGLVRVADVAEVSFDSGDPEDFVSLVDREGNVPVVHIALSKVRGTNATTVSSEVRSRLDELRESVIPSDIQLDILRDEGETASHEINKLSLDLVKSIGIVFLLLMFFLGMRSALVAAISIPLVLLVVFGAGFLAGETMNRITLFALILSLGLLVDDAIVVIENVARYAQRFPDMSLRERIVRAVDEVGGALALSTLTMALAFVPMAFVTGMMGPYMGPIPFFVPAALAASLIFSVTVNPFLAYVLAPKQSIVRRDGFFLRSFSRIECAYGRFLTRALVERRLRRGILLGTSALFLASIILVVTPLLPFRMLPKADKEYFSVLIDFPVGTGLVRTRDATIEAEKLFLLDPDVLRVESFVGTAPVVDFTGLFQGSDTRTETNQATLRIGLTKEGMRDRTSEEIVSKLRIASRNLVASFPDAMIRFVEDPPGPPVSATLLVKVEGNDEHLRERIADDLERMIRETKGTTDIDRSMPERTPDRQYLVRTEKASLLGVSTEEIRTTLTMAFSGIEAGLVRRNSSTDTRQPEAEYVTVRFARDSRDDTTDLSGIAVRSTSGALVPLLEIIEQSASAGELPILSEDRRPMAFVSAEMEGQSVVYASIDLLRQLVRYTLPETESRLVAWSLRGAEYETATTGERYAIVLDGEWKLTLDVFRDLGIVMGIALFLIYFVVAAKTESLMVPLLIMTSIPLGWIGVFPGFAVLYALSGTYFNATSMIGIIALAGLSVKNSIIYLEYLEPLLREGRPFVEALVEAGRVRLLPITLTSATAILGSLTIMSDPVWEGLAWALIFGLSMSTVLTLVLFPILYYYVMRKRHGQEEI